MLPLFSANAHIVTPPDVLRGRLPAKWAELGPSLTAMDGGGQAVVFDGQVVAALHRTCTMGGAVHEPEWRTDLVGFNTIASLDELRPGCYDAAQRVADMDADGIAAAACFSDPAGLGFGTELFSTARDPEFGLACLRAWNDWYAEEWVGVAPDRLVPVGAPWYLDPVVAGEEVRRNAARGFRGVVLRNPVDLDQPWLGASHWDPFLRACEETDTVIVHHTEALPTFPKRGGPANNMYPYGMTLSLYQACAMDFLTACLWGGLFSRFPRLRVLICESGGSWLPHFVRRLDWTMQHSPLTRAGWPDPDVAPLEAIQHLCWFSTQELDLVGTLREELGITKWLFEDDYPHIESVWPHTQEAFATGTAGLDADAVERLAWREGSELFRFPIPSTTSTTPAGAHADA